MIDHLNMESNTVSLPALESVTKAYRHRKGRDGGCRCGCLGTYWNKGQNKHHDHMIALVHSKVIIGLTQAPEQADIQPTYIDVKVDDQHFTIYFD